MEIKIYGAFVLNRRVARHAIDAKPARWRGGAGSSPLDGASMAASSPRNDLVKNYRVHPTHWLISTQPSTASSVTNFWAFASTATGESSGETCVEIKFRASHAIDAMLSP